MELTFAKYAYYHIKHSFYKTVFEHIMSGIVITYFKANQCYAVGREGAEEWASGAMIISIRKIKPGRISNFLKTTEPLCDRAETPDQACLFPKPPLFLLHNIDLP